ncbi:cytochrome P450 [Arthrobacter bambusae]|uniref:Cytochrome P450 n=1 Tax=Arthrobacter bambusae TaxID=1338426 RepID=A0AAW8DH17_9MICC|nr:cytochrome P450 [Arthrobacter bambusae]MDP9904675.1 cytochrome P450 [Arthrobacter bambusae]MDQ0129491.1 cytochrome P450 [Arthrobacter bambusae]MDQ0180896.1 cytochrome P450 [Arthrobacter bambusae]
MNEDLYIISPDAADLFKEEATLRSRGPATPVDALGLRAWSLTDPDLIKKLFIDPRISRDAQRHCPYLETEIKGKWPLEAWATIQSMLNADGADHKRRRDPARSTFTAHNVAKIIPAVEVIVSEQLDAMAAAASAGEPVDINKHFSEPIPVYVIAHVIGMPPHLAPAFQRLVSGMFSTTVSGEEASAFAAEFREMLSGLVALKRSEPADDLATKLVIARDRDNALSEEELIDNLFSLVAGGFETTVNMFNYAIVALLHDSEQLTHVREGRATWEDVTEEALRFATFPHLPIRFAAEDIPIDDGTTIQKGDSIIPAMGAASRHPKWHGENANDFDVRRPNKDHLAFGYGPHLCLGAPLVRAEGRIAFPALFDRFPDLQLAVHKDELPFKSSFISWGYQSVPVYLGAREKTEVPVR